MVLRRKRKFDHPGADGSGHATSLLRHGGGPVPTGWDVPAAFNFTRDVIEAYAARDSLRKGVAYIDHEGIVDRRTFTDVAKDAARWAHLLRARLDPGDRVLVVLGKVPAWHGAMLGALKGGLVAVPCSDMLRARDLAYRVRHSGARLVIADRTSEAEVEEMLNQVDGGVAVLYLDDARPELQQYVPRAPTEETAADDPALILYTSGTTKEPKGVVHTHAYTWAQRAQAAHWLDATEQDVIWCTAGSGWAKSIWNVLLGPWSHGAEVVVHEGAFDPEERLSLIERLGVTVLCQAPTEYRMLAKLEELQTAYLPKLRHAVSAGEPLNPEAIERFEWALGLTIHDGYGQTENSLLVANAPGTPVRAGSMGLPTPGHDVAVIDESGYVCPPGVEGDIALKGRPPTMFSGYWDAPDETEAVFRDGWYITGDRATRDEEGYLWFVGRADDVILSAAYRIGPFEVESALLEHPAVAESAVIGVPHPERGQIVKAFVVLRPGREGDAALAAELQEHAKAITAPYKYPRSIEFVDELPKTASGKIRRSELRALPHVEAPVESSVVPLPVRRRDEVAETPALAGAAATAPAETQAGGVERGPAEDEARRIAEAAEVIRRKAEEAAQLETELVALRAAKEQAEAEAVAARQAEESRQAEAEETARLEAAAAAAAAARQADEARLQAEADEAARLEAAAAAARETEEARLLGEAEEVAAREAEEARLRAGAEEAARLEAAAASEADEVRLRSEAEERARLEAAAAVAHEAEQARLRAEAEETARLEAAAAEAHEAEQARLRAEAEETARHEAAAAAREAEERASTEAQEEAEEETSPEDDEALRREAEEHARAEAEEIARVEAEIAMHREAAERARLEARAAEAFRRAAEAQSLEEPTIAVGEPTPTPTPAPELTGRAARRAARESEKAAKAEAKRVAEEEKRRRQEEEENEKRAAAEAERRTKEEAVLAKQREKEEAEQAKRDAQTAAQRAKEEAEQAKQRAKEEAEQAKRDAQAAAQRAKDEAVAAEQRAKEEEEQRKRDEAAAREEARRREAEEQATAKRREREKQKKGRGELTRLLLGGDDPGAEFTRRRSPGRADSRAGRATPAVLATGDGPRAAERAFRRRRPCARARARGRRGGGRRAPAGRGRGAQFSVTLSG